jgi:hypothetical protein
MIGQGVKTVFAVGLAIGMQQPVLAAKWLFNPLGTVGLAMPATHDDSMSDLLASLAGSAPSAQSLAQLPPGEKPDESAWVVTAGALASADTAQMLATKLRNQGYPVFVLDEISDGRVLYRVMVGPENERHRADTLAARLATDGYYGMTVSVFEARSRQAVAPKGQAHSGGPAGIVMRAYRRTPTPNGAAEVIPVVGLGRDVAEARRNLEFQLDDDLWMHNLSFDEIVCSSQGWWAFAAGTPDSWTVGNNIGMACGGGRDQAVSAAIAELKKRGISRVGSEHVWFGYASGASRQSTSQSNLGGGAPHCYWHGASNSFGYEIPQGCGGSLRSRF